MKTTLKYCVFLNTEPQEGIYRHQGKGGQGQTLAQSMGTAAETRPRPRFRGPTWAARAAF